MRVDPVDEFIRAFNERDLDAFTEVLHPDVEIHGMKGSRHGIEEAREWATRAPGGVQQEIRIVNRVTGFERGDGPIVVNVERSWHWDEDGSFAESDELSWVFELQEGRVRSWRPFEDREQAIEFARELPQGDQAPVHELD